MFAQCHKALSEYLGTSNAERVQRQASRACHPHIRFQCGTIQIWVTIPIGIATCILPLGASVLSPTMSTAATFANGMYFLVARRYGTCLRFIDGNQGTILTTFHFTGDTDQQVICRQLFSALCSPEKLLLKSGSSTRVLQDTQSRTFAIKRSSQRT
jgi:hypothetical protein